MAQEGTSTRRYNLVLPEELYDEVRHLAKKNNTTVVELLRKFIKLGLLAVRIQDDPSSALLIRDGETETKVFLL
jgi:hypothetical protein